ncbi:hypothetical protein [Pseudomonas sp. CC6-YY-74]|uniref:hypothetical protein n=1 Tax=Pseudomonas sp. CC6-YY-74 TaxID=1930532 RepID=UPI0009A1FB18|nr:hypothetical protein [Pseudomonas sp. CC6-YY-74]
MIHCDIRIEALQQRGRQLWQVRMGRRALTFHEELAARSFAAQLHVRLAWLKEQVVQDNQDN